MNRRLGSAVVPAGLALLIAGNLLVPFAIPTETWTPLNFTVLALPALLGVWALGVVSRRDWRVLSMRPVLPLLGLTIAAVLSFAVVNQPWVYIAPLAPLTAQLGGLSVFVLSAGVFIMAADQLHDVRWLAALTGLFLVLSAVHIAGRLALPVATLAIPYFQQGATGGSLFWTWSVALAFAQAVFNRRLGIDVRVALGLFVVATFYSTLTLGREWLSGWLPPLVAVVAILWIGAPRLAAMVTAVACVVAVVSAPRWLPLIVTTGNEYSLSTRVAATVVLAKIVPSSPALGFGPANYYHLTPLFPILGWYVHFSSHNAYVDVIAQTGLIGFGCFAWFIVAIARTGWGLRHKAPAGFAYAYVLGALGGLAGTLAAGMLCDWILPFVYNITLDGLRASTLGWLFLGGLLGLERAVSATDRQ